MANKFIENLNKFIEEKGIVILDGGLSNALTALNYDFNKSEIWCSKVLLDRPDLIKKVHQDYLLNGSDVITTVTYQLTFQKLRELGFKDNKSIYDIFELAIRLAEESIDEYLVNYEKQNHKPKSLVPLVGISVGSYGAYIRGGYEYKGNYGIDEDALIDFHSERIDFIASKINEKSDRRFIAFETIPSFDEAKALIKIIKKYNDLNAYISFSLKDGESISDGTKVEKIVELIKDIKQVFGFGFNCVLPEFVEPALQKINNVDYGDKKILCYPNNGDKYDEKTDSFIENSAAFNYIDKVKEWKENYNLSIIGGCCRVSSKDINRIRSFFI